MDETGLALVKLGAALLAGTAWLLLSGWGPGAGRRPSQRVRRAASLTLGPTATPTAGTTPPTATPTVHRKERAPIRQDRANEIIHQR